MCGYGTSKFLPMSAFKWIELKGLDFNKYTSISSKGWVVEFDLEYPKELQELHSDCPLAPDKIEIQEKFFLSSS